MNCMWLFLMPCPADLTHFATVSVTQLSYHVWLAPPKHNVVRLIVSFCLSWIFGVTIGSVEAGMPERLGSSRVAVEQLETWVKVV